MYHSRFVWKGSWSSVLLSLILVSLAFPVAAKAAAGASAPLRYQWKQGQVFAYEVQVTADREDVTDTMKGVITYTVEGLDGQQGRVTYRGGLQRTKTPKPGQSGRAGGPPFGPRFGPPGFPSFPRGPFDSNPFKGLSTTTNQLTVTPQGGVQSMQGDSQLPYLLGNLSLIVFEPLSDKPEATWTVNNGVTITAGGGQRSGPPFFRPPGFPGSPFGGGQPDKQTAGSEVTSLTIESDDGKRVTAAKRYELNQPETNGESTQLKGSGRWVFSRELGVSESLDFQQQLIVREGNTTTTVPLTVKYRLLTNQELTKYQEDQRKLQEEAQKKLAEMQRAEAEKPLSDRDRTQILEWLKSNNTSSKIMALQRLQGKTPKQPDPEIGAAVQSLLNHENRMVQDMAKKAAQKWTAAGSAPSVPASVPASEAGRLRTWTDSTGKFKVEAEFLGLTNDQVKLRRKDGREVTLPLNRLSPADQQSAQKLAQEMDTAADPFQPKE